MIVLFSITAGAVVTAAWATAGVWGAAAAAAHLLNDVHLRPQLWDGTMKTTCMLLAHVEMYVLHDIPYSKPDRAVILLYFALSLEFPYCHTALSIEHASQRRTPLPHKNEEENSPTSLDIIQVRLRWWVVFTRWGFGAGSWFDGGSELWWRLVGSHWLLLYASLDLTAALSSGHHKQQHNQEKEEDVVYMAS